MVSCLVEDVPQISQLNEVNDETLQYVQEILVELQRFDILAIVHQTMRGKYNLIRIHFEYFPKQIVHVRNDLNVLNKRICAFRRLYVVGRAGETNGGHSERVPQ